MLVIRLFYLKDEFIQFILWSTKSQQHTIIKAEFLQKMILRQNNIIYIIYTLSCKDNIIYFYYLLHTYTINHTSTIYSFY